tara:strand:- start:79 stop:1347 length:1269 start_codon:yes stop_codon:yes gene_type:complete
MGGGLMQLVAYGAQDIYLTGNPQITFFKVVYRRHTNFSMEAIEQTFNGNVSFDGRATATISRNGDLVSKMYLEIDPAAITDSAGGNFTAYLGNCLVKEVALEIGGQLIDKQYREWMSAWADLTEPNAHKGTGLVGAASKKYIVVGEEIGAGTYLPPTSWQKASFNIHGGLMDDRAPTAIHKAFVPLQFWFCRNPGLALPLIALQYHEVKVIVDFASAVEITDGGDATGLSNTSCKLWCDYIYLDTDERRRFAQVSHEYLIEQVQREQHAKSSTYTLNFNHPVKELIWGATPGTTASASSGPALLTRDGSGGGNDPFTEASRVTLKLNGHERFSKRHPNYFTNCQVYQHHTGHGGVVKDHSLNVYSFALKPEEHQPSGTCNFSRIDNAQLIFDKATGNDLTIFAVNYNVLRIMSGMGGLAYSN